MTMNTRTIVVIAAAAVLLAAAAPAAPAAPDSPGFLKGKVFLSADPASPLEKRAAAARADFVRTGQGDFYFTAYLFPSRSSVHHSIDGHGGPFDVTLAGGEVKFRGSGECENIESKDMGGPAGLLLLNSRSQASVVTSRLLDPEDIYEFKTVPVYWLGSADAEASARYLESEFERGGDKLRKSLVFVVSLHDTPRAADFLRKTALGTNCSLVVRKEAVFWAGESGGGRGLEILKEVLAKTREGELKKQAIFALTLTDRHEAISELIRIAKTEPDRGLRKEAIFWLGQKASQEAVGTLNEVVDKPDEDEEIKEAAVFAISQLPAERSVPMLAAMARNNKSPSVRKKALFWLGQTDSDEALKIFEEILLKK